MLNPLSKRLFTSFATMCNKARSKLPRTVLPDSVVPTKYSVHLQPCLKTFVFEGKQTVSMNVKNPVDTVILHSKDILVDPAVSFTGSDGKEIASSHVTIDTSDTTVTMKFPSTLPVGEGTLKMRFKGTLNDQMAGFYRSGYLDLDGKKKYMGTTQMEAIDARRMFPCVDEPAAKAVFELSVTAAAGLNILSNMPESRRTLRLSPGEDGEVLQDVVFMPSPKMSTYLVALCIGQFEFVQGTTKRGTLVRVLSTPGKANQCEFALDVGVRCLEWYEEFFDLNYPLPKLDMIGVPDFAMGAMENWGLVTYREIDLLCDIKTVSANRMQRLASVITHELAHQWFGNLVTMEWWDDLWLNEGFATFMQTLSADALFPEWKLWDQYITDDLDRARALDGLRSSHPVQVPIPKAEDVEQVFDAISYSKGACVVRVIYNVLGADTFKKGLQNYMKKHAYGNTVTDDLWDALQEATAGGQNAWTVAEMMGSWTKQMGYPVLKVKNTSSSSSRSLEITQEWFVADGSVQPEDSKATWIVPVFVGSSANPHVAELHVIKEKTASIPLPRGLDLSAPGSWVKLNFGEIAPIRIQYESSSLQESLFKNGLAQLSVQDRIGLLSDARALARAGRQGLADVVNLLKAYAVRGEDNVDVWTGIESTVNSIEKIASGLGKSDQLSSLVITLVKPQLERIGWDPKPTDGSGEKRMRACLFRLLSSFGNDAPEASELRNEAIRRFSEYKNDQSSSLIVDDTRTAIFRLALAAPESKERSSCDFEFLKNLAENPNCSQTNKLNIYSALGYVRCNTLKKATLEWTLTDKLKTQDFFYPIGAVRCSNAEGQEIAWNWIKENFPKCQARLAKASPSLLASVINQACGGNVLASRAEEIENSYGKIPSISRIMAQLCESIRSNASFLEREKTSQSANKPELWKL